MSVEPLEAVKKYDVDLKGERADLDAYMHPTLNEFMMEQHIQWMINNMPEGESISVEEKRHRWLGFIQGVMWATGFKTINQLRKDNFGSKKDVEPHRIEFVDVRCPETGKTFAVQLRLQGDGSLLVNCPCCEEEVRPDSTNWVVMESDSSE